MSKYFPTKKEEKKEMPKVVPKRLSMNIFDMQKGNKEKEEKPKVIPKKLDKSRFEMKKDKEEVINNYSRRMTVAIPSINLKDKLSIFNSSSKGNNDKKKKEEEKIKPKKLDMKRHSKILEENLKIHDISKEIKEIKKFDLNEHMNKMNETTKKTNTIEDTFTNTDIKDRESNFSELVTNLKLLESIEEERKRIEELRKKRIEERKKEAEEKRKIREEKRKKEEEERKKKREEERIRKEKEEAEWKKRKEEERKKREEERIKREEELKKQEEERKKKIEEELKRQEEERRKWEEEEKIRKEEELKLKEEERKKREEERKKREEERKKREEEERKKREEEERIRREKEEEEYKKMKEKWKKEEEERKKREEEELKKIEEEKKKREEDERKKREEEERKYKDEIEKLLDNYLSKINKKKEELSENELQTINEGIRYKYNVEKYEKIICKEYDEDSEGRNIKYNYEEIRQISTEPIYNLEVTKRGKIIVLTNKDISKITIYKENTYEEENSITFENNKVNSFIIDEKKIYCTLSQNSDNLLIISIQDTNEKFFLNSHNCSVTGVTITSYGYLVSADIEGRIIVWKDYQNYKRINDFNKKINTVYEINKAQQRIAILSFNSQEVKFYDLRYPDIKPLATIGNIMGSGLQNNMLKLNSNILAIAGTYIYIIDINCFMLTNKINCVYANDCISSLICKENKAYFFVSQALTNVWLNDVEKGIIGYYEYDFINNVIPDYNPLTKIGSKIHCHDLFISSIRNISNDIIVTGSFDGKIKFWKLVKI